MSVKMSNKYKPNNSVSEGWSNFFFLQYGSLLITQHIPKLTIFGNIVSYTWTCCLSSNRGNNKNTFDLGN